MLNVKSQSAFTALLSALAASLCCITPVIALVAGSSSLAANFSWLEPARPFLAGISIGVLALAWYLQLKPAPAADKDCCERTKKASFLQSRLFLSIVTVLAILLIAFPLYATLFYPQPKIQEAAIERAGMHRQQVRYTIQGMTCAGCEEHVNNELSKENGVLAYTTSYASRSSRVSFDNSKTDAGKIEAAINRSGYKVKSYELITASHTAGSLTRESGSCSKNHGKSCCEKIQ